jgi:hypothetical protein
VRSRGKRDNNCVGEEQREERESVRMGGAEGREGVKDNETSRIEALGRM